MAPEKKARKQLRLEKAAQDHLRLSQLLKQERSSQQATAVDRIMQQPGKLQEKIHAIERLDLAELGRQQQERPARAFHDPQARRNRKKLKLRPQRNGFFRYLFYDYARIKAFGRQTHIITTGLLPFSLKINKAIKKFFSEQLQNVTLVKLLKVLKLAEEKGWLHLRKEEYNLVMVFKRLCTALYRLDFRLLAYNNPSLSDRLQTLEENFLVCHARTEYIDQLILAVKKVLQAEERFQQEDTAVLIKRVLLKDLTLPSLYNLLLGLNMLKYRRFLRLSTLLAKDCGHLLSTQDFACDEEVYEKINSYLQEKEKNLLPILERRNEIIRIKSFLPREDEEPYELIENFYNDETHQPPLNYRADRENALRFCMGLSERFLTVSRQLLNGYVTLADYGPVEIFSHRFFIMEIGRLERSRERLEQLSYHIPNLPRQRFTDLKLSAGNALSREIEAVQAIDQNVELIVAIGRKLGDVVLKRQAGAHNEAVLPLEPEVLAGKTFTVPYAESRIKSSDLLHSRTVLDALSLLSCFCMVCGLYFKSRSIHGLLRHEKRIEENLHRQLETLGRIAEAEQFRQLRDKLKI